MASFAPTGFTPLYSNGVSGLSQPGLVDYPYNPNFYGFSGDIIVKNFYKQGATGDQSLKTPEAPKGYVYPYPSAKWAGNGGNANAIQFAPILGVAVGFKYQPKGGNGAVTLSSNWIIGTQIEDNTQVYVTIVQDIQTVFKAQAGGAQFGDLGISQTQLFEVCNVNSTNYYSVTVGSAAVQGLQFALGDTNSGGVSGQFLDLADAGDPGYNGWVASPFVIAGVTNGSNWYDAAQSYTETNQWLQVRIDAGWATTFNQKL